jgi:hypothetical protein
MYVRTIIIAAITTVVSVWAPPSGAGGGASHGTSPTSGSRPSVTQAAAQTRMVDEAAEKVWEVLKGYLDARDYPRLMKTVAHSGFTRLYRYKDRYWSMPLWVQKSKTRELPISFDLAYRLASDTVFRIKVLTKALSKVPQDNLRDRKIIRLAFLYNTYYFMKLTAMHQNSLTPSPTDAPDKIAPIADCLSAHNALGKEYKASLWGSVSSPLPPEINETLTKRRIMSVFYECCNEVWDHLLSQYSQSSEFAWYLHLYKQMPENYSDLSNYCWHEGTGNVVHATPQDLHTLYSSDSLKAIYFLEQPPRTMPYTNWLERYESWGNFCGSYGCDINVGTF